MKKLLVWALLIGAAYYGYDNFYRVRLNPEEPITLYSLSYCTVCSNLVGELENEGIAFVEYYVDKDPARKIELDQKMRENKVRGGSIRMPIVDLGVKLLVNSPSIDDIKKYYE